jgi:hypothetical protein
VKPDCEQLFTAPVHAAQIDRRRDGRQTKEATMKASTSSTRLVLLLVICAILTGTAASLAGAGTGAGGDRIVDDWFRDPRTVTTPVGDRIVDDYFRDAPSLATPVGDRIVDDYFRDAPSLATPVGDRIVDDYFRDAATVTVAQPAGSGFDWGAWFIGLVAGFGLALGIAGALLLAARRIPGLRKTGAPAVG